MSIIDIKSTKSASTAKPGYCIDRYSDCLQVGGGFESYVFFELPTSISLSNFKQANLILFKVPCKTSNNQKWYGGNYSVYPLLDFFSTYSSVYSLPSFNYEKGIYFKNEPWSSYTQIDITDIVNEWMNGNIENKGLLLSELNASNLLTYASGRCRTKEMVPTLRLIYEQNTINPVLTKAEGEIMITI